MKVNEQIKASKVTVIDQDKKIHRSVKLSEAIRMASVLGLDLLEVNPNQDPPVCKVVNLEEYFERRPRR